MRAKEPFEKVVAEHGTRVLRVCRVLLGRHDAEDAWSETFLAALRAYPDLPADANVEAWLVTIAHRKAIDVLRSAKRQPIPVDEVPADNRLTRGGLAGDAPADPAANGTDLRDTDLWNAVRTLPDKQRQAIAYRYVADLPYDEIARILGGTTDAARRAAADGLKNLRKNYPERMAAEGASS